MSIQHVGAVLYEMPELTERAQAFCLAAIADSADRETGYTFWKTLRAIARAARLTIRGARACVRELESRGYVRAELRGDPGRQTMRFRVLFDQLGKRATELELYPPAHTSGGRRTPPAHTSAPPAPTSGAPAPRSSPPNNPLIGVSVPSPSLSKDGQKAGGENGRRPDRIRDMSDDALEERAQLGKLTAQEERERELRRTMRSRERRA